MDYDTAMRLKYKKVLLKLSGEVLKGKKKTGLDWFAVSDLAGEIAEVRNSGVALAITLGGGNLFRGRKEIKAGRDRITADRMGMLSTVINALALKDMLAGQNIEAKVLTATRMEEYAEYYLVDRAREYLAEGKVLIFAGGLGHPYFSTDTTAAVRALEIEAEVLLKGTKVDGIYAGDPEKEEAGEKFNRISYLEVLQKDLGIMDHAAISLCRENNMPIIVFNVTRRGNMKKIVSGESVGTTICHGEGK